MIRESPLLAALPAIPRPKPRGALERNQRPSRVRKGWPSSEPRLIAAWFSGYYNAKRNNRVLDLQTFEENMSKVTNYCSDEKNFKVPVMKAVEQVLGKSK